MDIKGAMVPSLDIGWLPLGIQVVHLHNFSLVNGFAMEILPRELSYLYINSCTASRSMIYRLNFNNFPTHMEEFHLLYGWLAGTVDLRHLPQSMSIVHIVHPNLDHVIIDWNTLPQSVTSLLLCRGQSQKVRIVAVGVPTIEVKSSHIGDASGSKYYQEQCKALFSF